MGSGAIRPDAGQICRNIVIDRVVEDYELIALESAFDEDGEVARDEIRAFAYLLEHSTDRNGTTILTPSAHLYLNTHFQRIKEKARSRHKATKALFATGGTLGVAGIAGCFFFPASIIPKIVAVAGLALIVSGAVVMGDGSATVSRHFDVRGNLIVP